MNSRKVEFRFTNLQRKLSSPSHANSVIVEIDTKSEEIFVNPTTGHQTSRSTPASPSFFDTINLCSSSHHHIRSLLRSRFVSYHFLCDILAPEIATEAINLGFGRNGFTFTVVVTVTNRTVSVTSNDTEIIENGSTREDKSRGIKEFEHGNRVVFHLFPRSLQSET